MTVQPPIVVVSPSAAASANRTVPLTRTERQWGPFAAQSLCVAVLCVLLAACGGGVHPSPAPRPVPVKHSGGKLPTKIPPTPVRPPPEAQILHAPGLEGVIGATGAGLTSQFGKPRLDVREGDARKLQFSGRACVLDIYLYPPKAGGEPTATYAEARRASDGQEVDRAACVSSLRQR